MVTAANRFCVSVCMCVGGGQKESSISASGRLMKLDNPWGSEVLPEI